MKPHHPVCVGLVFAVTAVFLQGQVAPQPPPSQPSPPVPQTPIPPAAAGAEETVQMSPFEVRTDQDRGYIATNSLAGGRTNTPLRLTPAAISTLTRTFIDDLQVNNVRDSFVWTINVAPGNLRQNETPFGDYEFNFRGTGSTGNYPTRNYFLYYGVGDTYNTERFEFARGPNSILFGDAQLGGVATTFTKIPQLTKNSGEFVLQADTYGGRRATLDLNQAVNRSLAIRVNGLVNRGKGWIDHSDDNHDAVDVAVLDRLGDNTQVRVEGEMGNVQRKIYSTNYFDQASYWNGTTAYDGTTAIANPSAAGVNVFSNDPYFVFAPGQPGAQYANWASFYRTNGTGVALLNSPRVGVTNSPVLPKREFNLGPLDSDANIRYYSVTGWLDHRFTKNLSAQLSAYRFQDRRAAQNTELFNAYQIDVNRVLPGGQPNPKFGVPFAEAGASRQRQDRGVSELRGAVTYEFSTTWARLKQRFSVIGGARSEDFDVQTYNLRRVGGPNQNPSPNAPANQVRYRLYWDEPQHYSIGSLPTAEGYTFGYLPTGWFYHEKKDLTYGQLASNTTLWDDRVSVVLGVRSDHVDRKQRNPIYSDGPTLLGPETRDSASAVTSSAGLVYYPIKALGVFGNYSENFAPVTAGPNRLDGTPFGATRGRGIDYGVKVSLLEGQIYATLSRYESKQSGRIAADARLGNVRDIWRDFGSTNPALTTIDFRDTEALEAKGYELEVVANPTRNLRLSAGYARPETETVERLAGLRAYYAQHLPEWQGAIANGSALNPVALTADLDNLRQALESAAAGTVLDGTYRYTANAYATYTFSEGALRGWSTGAGIWGRGRQKIGSADPRILFATDTPTEDQRRTAAFNYQYAPENYSISAHVAYERKFGDVKAKFQLNVANLLNNDDPIFLSSNTFREGGLPTGALVQRKGYYNLPDPRKFTLTATFFF